MKHGFHNHRSFGKEGGLSAQRFQGFVTPARLQIRGHIAISSEAAEV